MVLGLEGGVVRMRVNWSKVVCNYVLNACSYSDSLSSPGFFF